MTSEIDTLVKTSQLISKVTADLNKDQLLKMANGFNNHIFWHMGHIPVTLALLTYKRCQLPMPFEKEMISFFGKGSSPKEWDSKFPSIKSIRELLEEIPLQIKKDYESGKFNEFESYETSVGINLDCIENSLNFLTFHNGIHLGYIIAQKRVLK
ncbi:MAG: damage-inducible protein DinB [Planctomycetota bacterium]|nr:MAG: damage-inducible protein DinB [Planctomycetota bacterium]